MNFNNLWPRLLIALASMAVVPLAAEVGLRRFRPVTYLKLPKGTGQPRNDWKGMVHVPSKTPGLLYELAPNVDCDTHGMRIRTNSYGMRDEEPLEDSAGQVTRIAALGDSFTFGFTVQQGEDFPAQLEGLLQEQAGDSQHRFDVLNFGVGGYSTWEEAVVLREKALRFNPDMIVIGYCLNDPEDKPIQPLHAMFQQPALWRHSHVLRFLASRIQGWGIQHYGHGNYFSFLHAPDGPEWPRVGAALDEIREMAAQRKIPVVLVVMPMLLCKTWKDYPFYDIHAFVAEEGRRRGFLVLDTLDALRVRAPTELVASKSDCHLNVLGNKLVAQALADMVVPILAAGGQH